MLTEGLALRTELSAARLRELVHYEPETGVFTRRVPAGGRNGKKFPPGTRVGSVHALGYLETGIDGRSYLLHRLAVLYQTGRWPLDQVDHINGVRSDNRWSNLREVDNRSNVENRHGPNRNNRSGFLGVHRQRKHWVSQIMVERRRILVGRFPSPEAAHEAYLEMKRELHKGNTL